jgi:mannose-1-phosphate guanylyltransferase/mannose-6-phosphate isomerase
MIIRRDIMVAGFSGYLKTRKMNMDRQEILNKILTVEKPWGNFRQFSLNEQSTVKILTVAPGQLLSTQKHKNRDELWVALDPGLKVELDGEVFHPQAGEVFVIMRGTKHRLGSDGSRGRVLEVSYGLFDEDDIERFDDIYGRV